MGPEILLISVLVAAFGALSASRQGGRDLVFAWRRGCAALAARRLDEAEECFRNTLRIAEQRFGPDHWRTALHANALAQTLVAQRRLDDAAQLVDRALGIVDRWSPMPHVEVAQVLAGAAVFESARGRHARALGLLERARRAAAADGAMRRLVERTLAQVEATVGHESEAADALTRIPLDQLEPSDVRLLATFATTRMRQGDTDRAVRCLTSAHAVVERQAPGEFAEAFYLGLLGEALARAGRDVEALRALERAVIDYDAVLGEWHPAMAAPLVELAEVRLRLGDEAGARLACERVLALPAWRVLASNEPYRTSATLGDPLDIERDRARAILARVKKRGS